MAAITAATDTTTSETTTGMIAAIIATGTTDTSLDTMIGITYRAHVPTIQQTTTETAAAGALRATGNEFGFPVQAGKSF